MWQKIKNSRDREVMLIYVFLCILVYQVVPGSCSEDYENKVEQEEYLRKYGYIAPMAPSRLISSLANPKDQFTAAVKQFQSMMGFKETGIVDEETRKMMSMPRCGVKDFANAGSYTRRKRRYALHGSQWNKKTLTYRIDNYTPDLTKYVIEDTIAESFEYWRNVTDLTFTKTSSKADILISFQKGNHGDSDPFDGPGGTLAHAFFPIGSEISGDMHFDEEETWTVRQKIGTNLLQVAVHELGHSLGLSHSDINDSVMAPFYKGYESNFKLHKDDIEGIQAIYGVPRRSPPSIPIVTTKVPKVTTGVCKVEEPDAMFSIEKWIFIFKGSRLYLMRNLFDYKAKEYIASEIFPNMPDNIDAAFCYEKYGIYSPKIAFIFKDTKVWKYQFSSQWTLVKSYPKLISYEYPGLQDNLDAAFIRPSDGYLYFFKGIEFFRYSTILGRVLGYSRPISNWRGIPDGISAVFSHPSRSILSDIYFVRKDEIYKFDEDYSKVKLGYPKTFSWFLGCPERSLSYIESFEITSNTAARITRNFIPIKLFLVFLIILVMSVVGHF